LGGITHFGGGITHFGGGILGIGSHIKQFQDIMYILTEFNQHNLQDTKEDGQLIQDQIEFNQHNLQDTKKELLLGQNLKEMYDLVALTICILRGLNRVGLKIPLRVEFKHLQGFNNE
jgi:hypothetical protein